MTSRMARPEDYQAARAAHECGRLTIDWGRGGKWQAREFARKIGWSVPLLGFEKAFTEMMLKSEDCFSTALHSSIDVYFSKPSATLGHFVDPRDDQSYRTLKFEDGRIWLAENLRYVCGDTSPTPAPIGDLPARSDGSTTRGLLYAWDSAVRACPSGWRLPTSREWRKLIDAHGGPDRAAAALIELGFDLDATGAWWSGYLWHEEACFWSETRPGWLARLLHWVPPNSRSAYHIYLEHANSPSHRHRRFAEASEQTIVRFAVRCVRV